ncbi:MAG TPA: sodium transporter, partial [Cyclobacteriaceae bacterium]|nr:sodium transporter [Cyclobacteriaceae bacterium]
FIMGFFWKRTTVSAALFAIIGGFILSVIFKFLPGWVDLSFMQGSGFAVVNPASGVVEIPFLDRMGFVFLICVVVMVALSLMTPAHKQPKDTLHVDFKMFKTDPMFTVGAVIVLVILATLYISFW